MIRLTKEFKFEMAHALDGYDGDCRFIHGHSFELWVTISGNQIHDPLSPKNGMLMDFNDLKSIVRQHIIDVFDHALVMNQNNPAVSSLSKNHEAFGNLVLLPFQPTSENLLSYFATLLKPHFPAHVKLHSLKIRETVTSFAEWYSDDND